MKLGFSIILIFSSIIIFGQVNPAWYRIKSIDSLTFVNYYLVKIENKQKDTFLLFQKKIEHNKLELDNNKRIQVGMKYCFSSIVEFEFRNKDTSEIKIRKDYGIYGINGIVLTSKQKAYTSDNLLNLYFFEELKNKCLIRKKWW